MTCGSVRMSRGRGQNLEAEAREFRGQGRGRGQKLEAEAEAKFLASRPVWPRGFNISDYLTSYLAPFPRYSLGKVQNRYIWLPLFSLTLRRGASSGTISVKFLSKGHRWPKYHIASYRHIAENFNRLSKVHERYRQTDDRQTDGR